MIEIRRGLPVKDKIVLNRLGRAMAKGMKASTSLLALSQVSRELDLTRLQQLRREQAGTGQKVSLNTLLMAAVARTLPAHPLLNAELVETEIYVYEQVNLGMAVSTPAGLVVMVIQEADRLLLLELNERIEKLAERARTGKIEMSDIDGGTFTVSNLGMFGVDSGFALPRPPESCVLLLGASRQRPAVTSGSIAVGETCWAALTYDHRFIDGVAAGSFLNDLSLLLNQPEQIFSLA